MTKLFLDDIRHPFDVMKYYPKEVYSKNDWEIVKNYDQFVNHIETYGMPDFISFDHDLADEHYHQDMYYGQEAYNKHYGEFKEKTGLECARFVIEYCMDNNCPVPQIDCHSMNPVGKLNILELFKNFKKHYE